MSEKVVYEPLKSWQGGESPGYYEPTTDTIHILLSDEDMMDKALMHEQKHRARRNKPTFKLAQIINTPQLKNLMYLGLLTLSIYGVLAMNFVPFLSIATVYLLTLGSSLYEEQEAKK